jgi:hypothetical protein
MRGIGTPLYHAWRALKEIGRKYALDPNDPLPDVTTLKSVSRDLEELEEMVQEAMRRVSVCIPAVTYAIGVEIAPDEPIHSFRAGPFRGEKEAREQGEVCEGDVLVEITCTGDDVSHHSIAGFMDGEWHSLEDEAKQKVATA